MLILPYEPVGRKWKEKRDLSSYPVAPVSGKIVVTRQDIIRLALGALIAILIVAAVAAICSAPDPGPVPESSRVVVPM
jgi:hypothetical protein